MQKWRIGGCAALCFASIALGGGVNSYTQTMYSFVDSTTPTTPQYQRYVVWSWTTKAGASPLASTAMWQVLRNCPLRDEISLITCNDQRGVELQTWSASAWGATSTVVSDCGTYYDRVWDAEYEQAAAALLAVYCKPASTSLYYRLYTTPSPSEQTYAPGLAATPIWIKLIAHPGTDEMVLIAATSTNLYAAVWNGTSFGNFTTLSTTLVPLTYPYDSAYTLTSGKAVVVWSNSASLTPMYTTWNGSAWATAAALPALSGTVTLMKLAPSPKYGGNEIMLACLDTTKHFSAVAYNGTTWGSVTTLDSNMATGYERRMDVAYEREGNRALALWHTNGQNALRYRTWSSGAWSGALVGPDMGSETRIVRLVPGVLDNDEVMAAVQIRGVTALGDYQIYSQTGVDSLGTTAVQGLVGQQIAGVNLPAAPSVTPGAVDKTYPNNTTTTIAPGSYRDLNVGNSFVGNLSAGTYIFRNASSGNGTTFNCDTTGGDVTIIFTGTVGAWNGLNIGNTGKGQVIFQLITGSFSANNNASVFNASVIAYAGSITFGNNTTLEGRLYANGNITVGSGTIEESVSPYPPSPGKLDIIRWQGGALSTPVTASAGVSGWASRQPWALSAPPFGAPLLYISRWREIGPDE
jgi:hypothetical protein